MAHNVHAKPHVHHLTNRLAFPLTDRCRDAIKYEIVCNTACFMTPSSQALLYSLLTASPQNANHIAKSPPLNGPAGHSLREHACP